MKKYFYLFLLLCGAFTLEAATITVTSGADAGAGTLRAAIASAVAGDDIDFSGVTTVTLTSAELVIRKNLTINGGTGGVTITRSAAIDFRIFAILSAATTVVFNKLSITNGKDAGQAGGINNNGNLTLNDCIIANNESNQGGGVQNNGTLTMNRCVVHSNKAGRGSGLLIFGSSTSLNNCVFTNNQRGEYAIDVRASGTLDITNCTIAKNTTGGINIANGGAVATLKNTIVAENTRASSANIGGSVSASSAYNLIGTEGGDGGLTNGTNNNLVGVSPLFADSSDPDGADNIFGTADDGLRLTTCNFAVNVGNNADVPSGTDIVGSPRIYSTTVDIGAYEFQAYSTPLPSITLGPYTAPTSAPTTYSISGTGITTVTDAPLTSSPITVNLSAAAFVLFPFTLTVKNANGCTSYNSTGDVIVNTPITQACATATFTGIAPIAPTASTGGVGGKGGLHIYTVPAGVTTIRLDARGAKGGKTPYNTGGIGARVTADYTVTAGDVLYILVGGKGGDGAPDGDVVGNDVHKSAGGGGGGTFVSKGPIGSGTLLLVAAGGGGAGDQAGGGVPNNTPGNGGGFIGAGGGSFSADGGTSYLDNDCGKGGKAATNGGNGGANACNRPETNGGGYGGGGAGNYEPSRNNAGGGGGGGYVGGNAGGTGGGNGGSNYNDPSATNVVIGESGDDNGSVSIVIVAGTQNMTWTGAISTDWNTPCNWSPSGVPTATNQVIINDVTNDPIILSGTTAVAKEIYINKDASLKVNSGGILNVNVTMVSNNITFQGGNSSLTNDGTINVGTGGGFGISAFGTATLTNRGTINTNNGNGIVAQPSGNFTFTNESTGIVNGDFKSGSILNLTNRGTINYSGSGFALSFDGISTLVNEGTIKITAGSGIYNPIGGIITNNACGKILMSAGNYTFSGATTNAGLISITGTLNNTGGTFTNTGVLKYGSLTSTVTNNQASSVIVRNLTYPIFAYGGTFSGTINGIFTDTLATVSAGTFAAPFAFTPLATLPRGIQTLYVKITNGACTYVVPFSYNTLTSSISKADAQTVALHQNRPNPFSQQTIISFDLTETDKAVLTVYDVNGRQVFMSNKGFKTGYNEVMLNKSVFQTTGTYFYRLTTDKFSTVKRLQFVVE
jgi:hypothetical protein